MTNQSSTTNLTLADLYKEGDLLPLLDIIEDNRPYGCRAINLVHDDLLQVGLYFLVFDADVQTGKEWDVADREYTSTWGWIKFSLLLKPTVDILEVSNKVLAEVNKAIK